LELIVLKTLEKQPADRYATAASLADDLRRFLEHRPISARAPRLYERAAKFCRRHQRAVIAAVCAAFLAAIGMAVSIALIWRAKQVAEKALAQSAQDHAHAQEQRQLAEKATDEVREHLYASDMKLAFQAWKNADIGQLLTLLNRHRPASGERDLRSFEWRYLWRLCHSEKITLRGHTGEVYCVAFSPGGRQIGYCRGRWNHQALGRQHWTRAVHAQRPFRRGEPRRVFPRRQTARLLRR
jgi:hypothetical protein